MALGAGHGGFVGKKARDEMEMRAQQMANANAQAQMAAAQRQQEIDLRAQQMRRDAARGRQQDAWNRAANLQLMDMRRAQLAEVAERTRQLRMIGEEEDRQRANRRAAAEGETGAMILASTGMKGFARNSMIEDYNARNNTDWTAFGRTNPITTKPYADGLYRFVKVGTDRFGNKVIVKQDEVKPEFVNAVLQSEFGKSVLDGSYYRNNNAINARTAEERKASEDMKYRMHLDRLWSKEAEKLGGRTRLNWEMDEKNAGKSYDEEVIAPAKKAFYGEYMSEGNNASTETKPNVPYTYRGMLSIPGVDNLISPNTEFESNGDKFVWDGRDDGELETHIKPVQNNANAQPTAEKASPVQSSNANAIPEYNINPDSKGINTYTSDGGVYVDKLGAVIYPNKPFIVEGTKYHWDGKYDDKGGLKGHLIEDEVPEEEEEKKKPQGNGEGADGADGGSVSGEGGGGGGE